MNTDIRVHIEFFDHAKTRRMLRELGPWGPVSLLRLWMYAAKNRPDGVLESMDADDIEDRSGWSIDQRDRAGEFFKYLTRNRWLDKVSRNTWKLHEWELWQPWVIEAKEREQDGRRGAHIKHHLQKGVSKPRSCEFCRGTLGGLDETTREVNAPAPIPKPAPNPSPVEGERESTTNARAREADRMPMAVFTARCREVSHFLSAHPGALQCAFCPPHAPHAPGGCASILLDSSRCACDEAEEATRLESKAAKEFERQFTMPWDVWRQIVAQQQEVAVA